MQSQHLKAREQFSPSAEDYARSAGHSDPEAMAEMVRLASPKPGDRALDIATGPGNVALALAPHVAESFALDLTPSMLEQAQRRAKEIGVTNLVTVEGAAEELPFPDRRFEIVVTRLAPHHFANIRLALSEMARVAASGARIVVSDTTVPESDELDREINEVERLRDSSHVRNYRPSEWVAMLGAAGLTIMATHLGLYDGGRRMDFDEWVLRSRTPASAVEELRSRFRNASPALTEALSISCSGDEISFVLPRVNVLATKP